MKILVICPRRVGDVFLATSVVHALRTLYPNDQLDMLVFRGTEAGVLSNPEIDNMILVPVRSSFSTHLRLILKHYRRYDIAISLLPSDRPVLYAWLMGKKRYGTLTTTNKYFWKKWALHKWVEFDGTGRHTLAMYHDIVADLVDSSKRAPQISKRLTEGEIQVALFNQWLYKNCYVVMHLTPKFKYKEWPLSKWQSLIQACLERELGVVLAGTFDEPDLDDLKRIYADQPRVLNLLNQTSIDELIKIICSADCYVGTDTAVTHMAAATGTPTIAIFGPSSPLVWGPWPKDYSGGLSAWSQVGSQTAGNVTLIQGLGSCVPCRQEGCSRHVESVSDCLVGLESARVLQALLNYLER
ncbi:MAG: glycosyltransferase family 9 protein [Proteobacteria bacterium]|nr:glycosyltransferase family 9 protein [Pseudomonadota bacterium]MDA1332047.1 glycosyltransferase family 9 protein [Pseudomonadota bacterium]